MIRQKTAQFRSEVIDLVGVFALFLATFYASQLPVCVFAVVRFSGRPKVGFGVSAVGLVGAKRRAAQRIDSPAPRRKFDWRRWVEKTGWMDEALRGVEYLYAHRLTLRVSVDATLGGSDAAQVALCWGAAQGLLTALSACTDGRVRGTLRADFSSSATRGEIRVTYAVKAGTALAAASRAVGEYAMERVKTWKSIPLKAS
ncbi:MAG: hypothetical protein Q4E13_06995 [Clostridia bacterium]|nr:hypothetical protein [Clostridia bacterium]